MNPDPGKQIPASHARQVHGGDPADPQQDVSGTRPQHLQLQEHREEAQAAASSSSSSLDSKPHGVDVQHAEEEFAALNRQLSHQSRNTTRTTSGTQAFEKGGDEEEFDLQNYLRGKHAEGQQAGIKEKRIGVLFSDLTVSGIGGTKSYVKTFPDAFVDTFNVVTPILHSFGIGKRGKQVDILSNFTGVAKPGEMVLVLGRPGAGCTTFLRTISNQRKGYSNISGSVQYGQYDATSFEKRFRGEAVYNGEDDIGHPVLTVGQTLGFAVDCKTPRKRFPGQSAKQFKESVITLLLKMFNIEHTRNTMVGNAFVRGVSGGERKRVSIAEMMITNAQITAWDNTTRGLDASTAFDYAKSLRIMTNLYKLVTFVSLYQASENIYQQFDKVLVIDEGREIYFGPTSEARAYFEGLGYAPKPRQTTPDYLTGCTDRYEREFAADPEKVPSTPQQLERAFRDSSFYQSLEHEIAEYREEIAQDLKTHEEFQEAVLESKRKFTPKHSVYMVPYHKQVAALFRRQMILKWADKFTLIVAYFTTIIIAIVLGTVYYKLPVTSAGAFTRGGILFIGLLFNALGAFAEMGSTMMGRPIVNKHRSYAMHRPGALWIAQIVADLAFASVQIMLFSIIVYFMCGLYLSAGAFFTFYIFILFSYMAMTMFFRTVGCVCPDFDSALKFAAVIITIFVIDSGYMIPYQSMQKWIQWAFWLDIFSWGFGGLMINEFKNINLTCVEPSLIPYGPSYINIDYRTCTLAGAVSGTDTVIGSDYISLNYNYNAPDLWRDFGVILAFMVFFLATNVFLAELVQFNAAGKTVTVYKKENNDRWKLNEELAVSRTKRLEAKGADDTGATMNIASKSVLTWENLDYDVPVKGGSLRLLNDIFGYVKPGQLTALMGASGTGKTTLLDVLAARKNIGVISGDVLVDGIKPGIEFQRGTAYCEQLDTHEPSQTVREALRFSAYLRQPFDVPVAEKDRYVEQVISLLEMENIADAIIGDATTGLAVEERKRVTIGVELAAKPELLLFLDEPTSGLDSQSAFNIVRFLRKLAAAGQAILCTIHQPNSALFENFDRLLLLQRGGRTVYFGEIGKDASVLRSYLERHGAHCPANENVAEYMLEAIGAGSRKRIGADWAETWQNSPEFTRVKEDIIELKRARVAQVADTTKEKKVAEYATQLFYQLKVVLKRTNLAFWRSPNYGFTRLWNHVVVGLLTGLAFLRVDNSTAGLQFRVFIMFQATILPALILSQVEPRYDMSRMIFYRESSSKMYSQFAFASSMVLGEIFYSVICAVGFFVCLYFPPGLKIEASASGYQFLMILITEFFSVTLGQMISAITPNTFLAMQLNPFIIITFSLFSGVVIPLPNLPGGWVWLYQLDPFTRLIGGMVTTELNDLPVQCTNLELSSFQAPPGQTCAQYARTFLSYATGYLAPADGNTCHYCQYSTGNDFFEPIGLLFSTRWRDLGIFAAFIGSNLIILFLASRYLKFAKR